MTRLQLVSGVGGALLGAFFLAGCGSSGGSCQPGAELCNGLDDDCDGDTDEGYDVDAPCSSGVGACLATGLLRCADDGAGAECDAAAGTPTAETCNQVDDDCDGQADEEVAGCCVPASQQACGLDLGVCTAGLQTCSGEGAWGGCLSGGSPVVLPGDRAEACNGLDDDCDGETDEGFLLGAGCSAGLGACLRGGLVQCTSDGTATACGAVAGLPAEESCNAIDDDCDGQTDEGVQLTVYRDQDADAYGSPAQSQLVCEAPAGWVPQSLDCDDTRAAVHPGADELCDGMDDDCDGQTDEGLTPLLCPKQQGVCAGATMTCGGVSGWLACGAEAYGARYQTLEATCDGFDNDCDGQTDEGLSAPPCALQLGVCAGSRMTCGGVSGWLACSPATYGAAYQAVEASCDGLDNDCDGATDEGVRTTWYRDADGDGHGANGSTTTACTRPVGYVASLDDCDDTRASVYPGASELCANGLDDDCDAVVDEPGCEP
jgi:hypothetical protein